MKAFIVMATAALIGLAHSQPIHHVSPPVAGAFDENIIKYCVGITEEMDQIISNTKNGLKTGLQNGVEMGDTEGSWYYYEVKSSKGGRRPRCPAYCRAVGGVESCVWWHVSSDEYRNESNDLLKLRIDYYHSSLFPDCKMDEYMLRHLEYWYDRKSSGASIPNNANGLDFGYSNKPRGFRMMDVGGGVICPVYCGTVGDFNSLMVCFDHMSRTRTQISDPRLNNSNVKANAPGKFVGCEMSDIMVTTWNTLYGYSNERFWHENQISPEVQCPVYMALGGGGCANGVCYAFRTTIARPWESSLSSNVAGDAFYDHIQANFYTHCGMSNAFEALINAWATGKRSGSVTLPKVGGGSHSFELGTASSFQFLSTSTGVCPVFCRSISTNSRACVYWHQENLQQNHPPTKFTDCVGSLNYAGSCDKPVTCDHRYGVCEEGSCYGAGANGECTTCLGEVDGKLFAGKNCDIPVGCDERWGTCTEGKCKGKDGNGKCDIDSPCQVPYTGDFCTECDSGSCSATATSGACAEDTPSCTCIEGFKGVTCETLDFPDTPSSFMSDSMSAKCDAIKLTKVFDETKRNQANYCLRSKDSATAGDAALLAVCGALTVNRGDLDRGSALLEQSMLCAAGLSSLDPLGTPTSINTYILGLFEATVENDRNEREKIGFRNAENVDTVGWRKHPTLMSIFTLAKQLHSVKDYDLYDNPVEQVLKRAIPLPHPDDSEEDLGLYFYSLHKSKFDIAKYCKTTCQCGEVLVDGNCVAESNPVKLLENYVLWARCAALPETLSKIPRELLIQRAATCVSISTLTTSIRKSVSDSISDTLRSAINNIRQRAQQLVRIQIEAQKPLSTPILQSMTVLQQNDANIGSSYSSLGNVHTVPHHVRIADYQDYLRSFASRCRSLAIFLNTLGDDNDLQGAINNVKTMKNLDANTMESHRLELIRQFLKKAKEATVTANESLKESKSELDLTVKDLQEAFDRISASTELYNEASLKVKEEQQKLLSDNLELVKELHNQESAELLDELDGMLVERVTLILDFTADMTALAREAIEGIGLADLLTFGGATAAKVALYAVEIGLRAASFAETLIKLDGDIQSLKDKLLAKSNRLAAVTNRLTDASNKIGETITKIADQWVAIGYVISVALPKEGEIIEAPDEIYSNLVQTPVYWENLNARISDVLQFEGLCNLETLSPAPTNRRRLLEYQGTTMQIESSMSLRRQPVGDHMRRRLCESNGGKNDPPANCEPDVAPVPDGADADAEAVRRSARIDDLQGKLGTTCASFKTRVTGMTSYGQDAHETALRAVSLSRRVGHLREIVRVQERRVAEAKEETSAVEDAIRDVIGDNAQVNAMTDAELADIVDLMHDAYITDSAVQLLSTGMARLLDLCNSVTYVAPNRLEEISNSCQPFRSIPLDPISINSFADELDDILDKFSSGENVGSFSDFVYDSIPQVSKANTMDVTHMLQPSLEDWVASNFNGSFSFGLRGPYAVLEDEGVIYKSSVNRETQSGPYFCNHHNVQATSLGVIFLGENDVPLGPEATLVENNEVVVSISLSGNAVKTYGQERFHYNIAPYKGIRFSYHLPSESGCRTGEKIANLCRGDTQVNFGNSLPLPSPYMDWQVKVLEGTKFLAEVKKVVVVADFQSVNLDEEKMTCYRPPVLLKLNPSSSAGLIGGIIGGLAAAALIPVVVWYAKKHQDQTATNEVSTDSYRDSYSKDQLSTNPGFEVDSQRTGVPSF